MICVHAIEVSHEANQLALYCREHSWYVKIPNHSTVGQITSMTITHSKEALHEGT